jgi:hypothetical protein
MIFSSARSWRVALAFLLPVLVASGNARANASFTFEVSGILEAKYYGPGGDLFFPWTGHLTVVLDTASDGTYTSADMVSFDMVSTGSTFHQPAFAFIPFEPTFSVEGGKLVAIDGVYYEPGEFDFNTTTFSGLKISNYQPLGHRSLETFGTGILTPVPEPAPQAMLLMGLAVAIGARIRGARSRQGGFSSVEST